MTRIFAAFLAICAIFGTTFGAIALGDRTGMPPFLAAGARFAIGGALVLGFARLRGTHMRIERRDIGDLAVVALCVTALNFGMLYFAERTLPSGIAALIASTTPLFTVIFGAFRGQARFDPAVAIGLVLGMLGTSLVVAGATHASLGVGSSPFTALALLAVEPFFAFGLIRSRALAQRLPTLVVAGTQMLAGGLALLGLSLVTERGAALHLNDTTALLALLYLTTVATAFAHSLQIWLAAKAGATFASSWTYVSPFIALGLGALVLHERSEWYAWLGGALVVVACVAVNRNLVPFLAAKIRISAAN